jgi:hypothetical protein
MTDITTTADIIPLRKKPKTGAERQRAFRARKAAAKAATNPVVTVTPKPVTSVTPVTAAARVTSVTPVTSVTSRPPLAAILLTLAAVGLACVGVTMNAWFARSLGSTDIAGWLFLAVGVAADLAALAIPSAAARLWETYRRGRALVAALVWLATFAFALSAGIGFASVNISDVTAARASRVTPAVTAAQAALTDAMTARDRECKGGVGKFCRDREQAVNDRRGALEIATHAVEQEADPQTDAARRIVAWLSFGALHPSGDDFAMLRLVLLALLPQIGGVLLMLGRVR